MRGDELRALLDRRPFQPNHLHISRGDHLDVVHPEMAIVSRSLVAVGLPPSQRVADEIAHDNLTQVVKITPIPRGRKRDRVRRRRA